MSKPNFKTMSKKELQSYILEHRDDQEAFYAFVDKLHSEANWVEMPPLSTLEDLEHYPEFTKRIRNPSDL
ncbi:hypothetical protein C7H19_11885 [Aphanothece hegewaldii CCALA 016]|uniref:Uncharacterized protein n=1 Tax=Aphanothece hegewaldii CCALA 016 TaxID=2107694 RepID=A0A2T1LXL8_9CHRO|nr:hypothetical protein [Aphanothece hegewaldii]PSF37132.1 hypothetical protein C7H19_11885 [Aphanothece hegewaldii CCALA 016]